ncbi:hypothetical protein QJQ45_001134 [Haematococcus lacustris]|nr:hypothetical protein QJQ45_001134 [Haematococcus lacustris]
MWPAERIADTSPANPAFGLCCARGQVQLYPMAEPPEPLARLLQEQTQRGREFRQGIRQYNCSLQLASSAIRVDRSIHSGVQQIVVNGAVHHHMGGLQPAPGEQPRFAQLYILDPQLQLERRLDVFENLDQQVLLQLQHMLLQSNPYVQGCRSAMERAAADTTQVYRLIISADVPAADQRRYSLPVACEIAGFMPGAEDDQPPENPHRQIVVHTRDGTVRFLSDLHPSYHPMHFVLLFPRAEDQPQARQRAITPRQHAAYRLMQRPGESQAMFCAGRLMQEYAVDCYCQVENQRLRYLRCNQPADCVGQDCDADCVGQDDNATTYQTEYLNTLQPQGFPPHHLKLKVGLPIMLLRNISPTLGLANGTRLLITNLRQHVLVAKILTGSSAHVGTEALIPRCTLTSNEEGLPFTLIRRQFPIKPAFAMTINKSQGQTFRSVGVYLPSPVFSHGQLYVAMSRVGQASGLSIMAAHPRPARATDTTAVYTENVVYTEVFNALPPGPDDDEGCRTTDVAAWLFAVDLFFTISELTDAQRIVYVATLLSGHALLWYRSSVSSFTSWTCFVAAFERQFAPVNRLRHARDRLAALTQTSSVRRYLGEFTALCLEVTDLSPAEQLDRFIRGLKPSVRPSRSPYRPPSTPRPPRPETAAVPMELDAMLHTSPSRNRGTRLSDAQRAALRDSKACFYCRKAGHTMKDCPISPPRPNVSSGPRKGDRR